MRKRLPYRATGHAVPQRPEPLSLMLRPMTMRFLAVPLLLALAACSGSNEVGSLATPDSAEPLTAARSAAASQPPSPPASPLPGVLVEKNCPGDCNAGFALDGKNYFVGCEPVSPGSVANEAMGGGVLYGRQVTVRRIKVGTNAGQVAVGPMEDYCGPGTVAPGYYIVAPPVGS